MRWIVLLPLTVALASQGGAATESQCAEILQHALESKNPETRMQAVAALSLAAVNGKLFDQLKDMLQDKDAEVRQAVVASLADIKSANATAALRTALEDAVPEVSFAADLRTRCANAQRRDDKRREEGGPSERHGFSVL